MAQQTAVDWLLQQIESKNGKEFSSYYTEFIEQAKAMEKEKIMNAYGDGQENGIKCQKKLSNGYNCNIITSMQYYNETYNK